MSAQGRPQEAAFRAQGQSGTSVGEPHPVPHLEENVCYYGGVKYSEGAVLGNQKCMRTSDGSMI